MRKRPCPICGNNITGRSDKKFCSPSCKNKYHHPSRNTSANTVKMINRFLHQNFKILETIFADEKAQKSKLMIPRLLLEKMGFHFSYCTGFYKNKQGKLYHYIYDYAWMEFSSQELMLVRNTKKGHG